MRPFRGNGGFGVPAAVQRDGLSPFWAINDPNYVRPSFRSSSAAGSPVVPTNRAMARRPAPR